MPDIPLMADKLARSQARRARMIAGTSLLSFGVALGQHGRSAAIDEARRAATERPFRYLASAAALGFLAVRSLNKHKGPRI